MSANYNNAQDAAAVIIKKYANRRLYHTGLSSYVTLDFLAQMIREGIDFIVRDVKSGDDITRQILTQIIMEAEAQGNPMLPFTFLQQLICAYSDPVLMAQMQKYLDALGK